MTEQTAWRHILGASAAMAALLTVASAGYGYHRDELYFRMLPPSLGYVDQPALAPWLARTMAGIVDEPWALRLPATAAAAVSVIVIALITRDLGGDRRAQALSAWGYAFAAAPLILGHLLLTSTIDLLVLPAVAWFAIRAIGAPLWWLAVGGLVGAATWNRWVVVVLVAGLGLGILLTGPRRVLRSTWLWCGAALAAVVAAPNLAYQATHDWPQLSMGQALAAGNADEVRVLMWPMLALLLGPPLMPIWIAGLWGIVRRDEWRDQRWIAVTFVVVVAFTFAGGAQVHYLMAILPVLYAAGCVPVAGWVGARRGRRALVAAGVGLNAMVSLVIALPVIPVESLGATPVTAMSPVVGDTVGWEAYVTQVAAVRHAAGGAEVPVLTTNYGEAGALDRFGPAHGITSVHSGHNALWDLGPPPGDGGKVIIVGGQLNQVRSLFASCEVQDRLDNGLDVDNEEQGQPIALCHGLTRSWSEVWPQLRHLS